MPFQPGSQKPAVAWTISPRRPSEDFPSIRATMSSGSATYSSVAPRQNSPGWMTNGSSASIMMRLGEVASAGRAGRSPRRGSCETRERSCRGAGRRSPAERASRSHGSIVIVPSATSRRIVPSESTEALDRAAPGASLSARPCAPARRRCACAAAPAAARPACGPRRGCAASAARRARVRGRRRTLLPPSSSPSDDRLLVGLVDRPPDDPQHPADRDLEQQHQPDEGPGHAGPLIVLPVAGGRRMIRGRHLLRRPSYKGRRPVAPDRSRLLEVS